MNPPSERLGLTAMRSVRAPRGLRVLAIFLCVVVAGLPPALLAIPWQQNVQATGKVTALDPLDRIQTIPAPVTGRLVELNVQEGVWVEQGEVLARMADQDPQYVLRLEQQLELAKDKVEATQDMIQLLVQQREFAEQAREQAISSARFAFAVADENVRVAEQELTGLQAVFQQKKADLERKQKLWDNGGIVSELDLQLAEAAYLDAQAKVEAAKSKVEQARSTRSAKEADIAIVSSEEQAKIEKIKSDREEARQKLAEAQKELTEATTALERQNTAVVTARQSGYIQRVHAANTAELLSQGSPLIEMIPDTGELAVELWVRGIDAPLISPGRKVRLQFEGWPAVQFAGWPSVAVGTFGGVVRFVDAHGNADGMFRVLILPDPDDAPWPERIYLRQGVRTNGWLLLDTVSVGYEIWRNLNAFPPTVRKPDDGASGGSASTSAPGGGGGKKK